MSIEIDQVTLDHPQKTSHRASVLSDLADSEARGDLGRSRVLRQILDQETHMENGRQGEREA